MEGKGPQRHPQQRLGRRLEEVAEAVWGRLLSVANAIESGTWRQGGQWLGMGWAPWRGGGGCQLLGPANAQTAHPATFSTAPAHQLLGPANAETTPARAPAAAAARTQTRCNMRRDERMTVQGPIKKQQPDGMSHGGCLSPPFQCSPGAGAVLVVRDAGCC